MASGGRNDARGGAGIRGGALLKLCIGLGAFAVLVAGLLVANARDPGACEVASQGNPWHRVVATNGPDGWRFEGDAVLGPSLDVPVEVAAPPGTHNRDNLLAAAAACDALGHDAARALESMSTYELPMRRMQVIHEGGGVVVIDDFAHHPTSIGLTIEAVRGAHGGKRLVALFEPRSNTMRMGRWAGRLAPSLVGADRVLALGEGIEWDLAAELEPLGGKAEAFGDVPSMLAAALGEARGGGAVLLLLSNGDFGGLRQSLPAALGAG